VELQERPKAESLTHAQKLEVLMRTIWLVTCMDDDPAEIIATKKAATKEWIEQVRKMWRSPPLG